jgi:hypothetical protein
MSGGAMLVSVALALVPADRDRIASGEPVGVEHLG